MQNRSFVILGGSGGIGSETARRLSDQGADLMLAARDESDLKATAAEVDASYHVMDATEIEQVESCIDAAVDQFGSIDGLVNCVGSIILKPAHRTNLEEWRHTVSQNLDSAFFAVRAAAKRMRRDGGSIVLLSSAAAQTGLANHDAIAAAKGGVIGLTRAAAASYSSRNIRVNCIAPGLVDTPMAEHLTEREATRKKSLEMHPAGRLGTPEDIASAIVWMLDPDNDWVTGQVLGVDGGLGSVKT